VPTFEVHYLADESKGWPDGYEPLGEVTTSRTAEAVTTLGKAAGVYRVREVSGEPGLWRRKADGTVEQIDAI
jgi:hypothetical protein